MSQPVAIAIACHPDDIEFTMAGTLVLLREAGYETHYLNVASGSCGSFKENAARTRVRRRRESKDAARILGAHYHPSLAEDLEVLYEVKLLRRLAAVIRDVKPTVVLTHSLTDYMEDHTNTARLAVSAAFTRGMPNFYTSPRRPIVSGDVTVYHALPHGGRDAMNQRVIPESFVDVSSVLDTKRAALEAHRSQKEWLDVTQGLSSYTNTMEELSRQVGALSKRFRLAEGWRRHNPLGFCAPDADPLQEALGKKYRLNPLYRRWLEATA